MEARLRERERTAIQFLNDCDNSMYLDSVLLGAICVCSFKTHMIGQPEYIIAYPVRDFAAMTSSGAVIL